MKRRRIPPLGKYNFGRLKTVGDSIPVRDGMQLVIRNAARAYGRWHGFKVAVRPDPETGEYYCWRVS